MVDVSARLAGIRYTDLSGGIRIATVTFDVRSADKMPPRAEFSVPIEVYVTNGDEAGVIAKAREFLHGLSLGLGQAAGPQARQG